MKVTTKFVVNIETGEIIAHDWYEYRGPVALGCGGDKLANQKKAAADAQQRLADEQAAAARERNAIQTPFIKSRVEGGLPFMKDALDFTGGTNARAFAPARAALIRRMGRSGSLLPSGFREQALTDFEASRARGFDDNIMNLLFANEATKGNAAGLANPLGFYGGAGSGYNSVVSAPPVQGNSSFWGGMLQKGIGAGLALIPGAGPAMAAGWGAGAGGGRS
jgi:hypothetical protein